MASLIWLLLFRYGIDLTLDGLIVLLIVIYLKKKSKEHTRMVPEYLEFGTIGKYFSISTLIGRISFIVLHSLLIVFTSAYGVRLALSLVQFAYIISIAIISCCFVFRKTTANPDTNFTATIIQTARNPFFHARDELQKCQRSFRKDAIQSASHGSHLFESTNLEEGIDQLNSQSKTIKWKHY